MASPTQQPDTTMHRLIQLQDASRKAHETFLNFEPPSTQAESRAFERAHTRYGKALHAYVRYLEAYMTQHGVGTEVYAQIEAARQEKGASDAS